MPFASVAETVVSYLRAVGIRTRVRALERAEFGAYARDKKATGLLQLQSGSFGNAVTRIERHMVAGGDLAFGSYAEIDDLFQQQAREPDRGKREAFLHAIQRIAYERVMFAPIWQVAQLNGARTGIHEPGIGLIDYLPYSAPYEDLRINP
jgi:ABC-type transport system substrate-binding protein